MRNNRNNSVKCYCLTKQLLLISFLSIYCLSLSQSESVDYILNSEIFQEERTVSVFIPEAYNSEDTTSKYNVAYLFDGQFQPYFSMVSSIMSYYEQTNEGIPLIIVGIHSQNRWGEFVPLCDEEKTKSVEGADKLSLFLKQEVAPLIESNYRTTKFKIGIGHSLGGTFVINEIIKDNSLFNAVIAVSPNLTMCNEQITQRAQEFYTSQPKNMRFIYTSSGTVGKIENDFRNSLMCLDSVTTRMNLEHMYWNCDILNEHNHMTTFVPTFDAAYRKLSSKLSLLDDDLLLMANDTSVSIASQIVDFYDNLTLFSEEQHELGWNQIMEHATALAQLGKLEACIDLCEFAKVQIKNEDLSADKTIEILEMIESKKIRATFNALAQKGSQLAASGDYIGSSKFYLQAFDLNLIRATHMVRMAAVHVLAQAGEIEEAFKQLDLLANKFELGGNSAFIDDPLCAPLHKNKKWGKLMDQLEKNAKLYR